MLRMMQHFIRGENSVVIQAYCETTRTFDITTQLSGDRENARIVFGNCQIQLSLCASQE